jgi:hypothetical protein
MVHRLMQIGMAVNFMQLLPGFAEVFRMLYGHGLGLLLRIQ